MGRELLRMGISNPRYDEIDWSDGVKMLTEGEKHKDPTMVETLQKQSIALANVIRTGKQYAEAKRVAQEMIVRDILG